MPGKRAYLVFFWDKEPWPAKAIAEQLDRVGQEQGCPIETLDAIQVSGAFPTEPDFYVTTTAMLACQQRGISTDDIEIFYRGGVGWKPGVHIGLITIIVAGQLSAEARAETKLPSPVEVLSPPDEGSGTARSPAMTGANALVRPADGVLVGHTKYALSCAVSPDGTAIVAGEVGYPEPGALKVWEVATGTCRHTLAGQTIDVSTPLAVGPDGTWFASAGGSTATREFGLRIWDFVTGSCRQTLMGHTASVHDCAVAPDGTWLVSASNDTSLRIWDVATGTCRRVLVGHERNVYTCAVSPDGTWIVSAGMDGTVRVWDVATGVCRRVLVGHTDSDIKTGFAEVHACAVSPDGTWVVSAGGDGTLRIWDVATGRCRHVLVGHSDAVFYVAVSPDGKWIVSGCNPVLHGKDLDLRVWDPATGACLHVLRGHTGWVNAVAASPDGRWVVSASRDHTLRIWDPHTGACLRTLVGHDGGVASAAVSPDSTWIVSTGYDQTLRIWDVATGICRLPRSLSDVTKPVLPDPRALDQAPPSVFVGVSTPDSESTPGATVSPGADLPSPPAPPARALEVSQDTAVDEALLELDALTASLKAATVEITTLTDLRNAGRLTAAEYGVRVDEVGAKALLAIPQVSAAGAAPRFGAAPTRSAPGETICRRCRGSYKSDDMTCPHCGHTQWGLILGAALFCLAILGAAILWGQQIADPLWHNVVYWGGALFGVLGLIAAARWTVLGLLAMRRPKRK